jgi:3-oxoacyl-[acyl-carrier protein] reductase
MDIRLDGEIALVTGASRGIGQAIALELARAGATVIGTATSDAGAQRIGDELAAAGLNGAGMVFNAADREGTVALVDAIKTAHGAVSILVNNAGITRDNLLLLLKDDDWDAVLDTNLGAAFRLARACARGMTRARRGRIINIGSVVGAMGNAGQVNYAAAKAGLAGFTRALARELASRSITVNTVAPGFIDTDMTAALTEDQRTALLQSVPLGRFGDAGEVAALVAYLASPQAGYITGQTLHINGGMYLA